MSEIHNNIIDALAAYRITRFIIEDELTADLRNKWFQHHDPASTKLGYLPTCPWCTGFWVAAGVIIARTTFPRTWKPIANTFALSTVVGTLYSRI